MRALALAAIVAAAVSAAAAPGAQAQRPCWGEAVREWVRIGYVRDDHPLRCYREALARVDEKTDLAVYSDLSDSIRTALAAAVARAAGEEAPPRYALEVRRASSSSAVAAAPRSAAAPRVPLPLLVLGGVGGVLVVAGAVGGAIRRRRPGRT